MHALDERKKNALLTICHSNVPAHKYVPDTYLISYPMKYHVHTGKAWQNEESEYQS